MRRALALGLSIMILLALAGACSDDAVSPDAGADTQPPLDQSPGEGAVDATDDLAGDAPVDGPLDVAVDAAPDASQDVVIVLDGTPDAMLPDGPVGDLGTPDIWGTISRSVTPLLDAKGTIYIGLYDLLFPFQVAGTTLKGAHLATTNTKINYAIYNAPAGKFNLQAFLDDNSNTMPFPFPMADDLDLVAPTQQIQVTAGTSQQIDIVLSQVPAVPDGGVDAFASTMGALKGTVTASVPPSLDGKGALYVSLHSQPPPGGKVAGSPLANSDLSSPYSSETYYLGGVQPGNYYLRVFLDDNGTVNVFNPAPDSGDLVHSSPIQVHVVAGTLGVHDVVLDQVNP
jgi:uncharacterized protein (DUF2141 family)